MRRLIKQLLTFLLAQVDTSSPHIEEMREREVDGMVTHPSELDSYDFGESVEEMEWLAEQKQIQKMGVSGSD